MTKARTQTLTLPHTVRSSNQQLPQNVHIYGGTDQERRALEARLQRVYQKSPMLQLESTGIVILNDSFPASESASSAPPSSSAPLLQALLEFPLIRDSTLLTVFNVGQQTRRELVAARGEDVVEVRASSERVLPVRLSAWLWERSLTHHTEPAPPSLPKQP